MLYHIQFLHICQRKDSDSTMVNVYVDLVIFTRIASTLKTGIGRYWCLYYVEKTCHDYRTIELDHF